MRRVVRGSAQLALRGIALPWLLGLRWIEGHARVADADPTPPRGERAPTRPLSLAVKIAADELFFAAEILSAPITGLRDRTRVANELGAALRLHARRGWSDAPETYHRAPPPLERVKRRRERTLGMDYEHVAFSSGWTPDADAPGRERWLARVENRTAHARLLAHPGRPRPWVVCTPGYRMGSASTDFLAFRAAWLHYEFGLNVAVPVLPLHGPRASGVRGGDGFLSGDVLDLLHAQAQAVWDVRRLIGWLRGAQRAPAVGVYGVSLGAYTAALVAGLDAAPDCVVAGIPASDWLSLLRSHAPRPLVAAADRLQLPWNEIEQLLRVVSPLALRPRVPRDARTIFAATHDRLARPEQALALWEHWEQPRLAWYEGSHVSFVWEPSVLGVLGQAFSAAGLMDVEAPYAPPRSRTEARPTAPAKRPPRRPRAQSLRS